MHVPDYFIDDDKCLKSRLLYIVNCLTIKAFDLIYKQRSDIYNTKYDPNDF